MMKETIVESAVKTYRALAKKEKSAALWDLSDARLKSRWIADIKLLETYVNGLERSAALFERNSQLFDPKKILSFEERRRLWGIWQSFMDYQIALDTIKTVYGQFPGFNPSRDTMHNKFFMTCLTAFMAQYSCGLRLIRLSQPVKQMHVLLNEEVPESGIQAGGFERLKFEVIHVNSILADNAGYAYFEHLLPNIRKIPELGWMFRYVLRTHKLAHGEMKKQGAKNFASNTLDIIRGKAFQVWFPVQKEAAKWVGEATLRKNKVSLISTAQIETMSKELEPGDIIFERKNWEMSNIGLPGFWPHVALYVGSPEQLAGSGIKRTFREKWERFCKKFRDGKGHRVIEAIGDGVIFNSLEHSCDCDYVAILRPRLPKEEKLVAIERAFHYEGRPYDFDFDFTSDSSLVCSELVWKCYQPGGKHKGLDMPLVEIAGRPVLPPNEIVRRFAATYGKPEQVLDFVYFLDGIEAQQAAIVSGVEYFLKTPNRSKWDFLSF